MTQTRQTNHCKKLLNWFDQHGRKNLPWQNSNDPYPIWVSEIMLQQTRVETVIRYYPNFMHAHPTITELAQAQADSVMANWAGLGYYARARNLHKAAKIIVAQFQGVFPDRYEDVVALPGIGRSTAGAILVFAHNQRHPILDGNVKRVLARTHMVDGATSTTATQKKLWTIAESLTPAKRIADYTQAMMDLGATLCTRHKPRCCDCPLEKNCLAYQHNQIDRYPARPPRRVRPARAVRMLILRDRNNHVLIERRPPGGIWGGLWSLPQVAPDAAATEEHHCREAFGLRLVSKRELPAITTRFTHFDLRITPIDCVTQSQSQHIKDAPDIKWYSLAEHINKPTDKQARPGFPAAVSGILAALTAN